MAQVLGGTSEPAPMNTAEMAKDRLWEYQLRRENQVILKEIRDAAKRREANTTEVKEKEVAYEQRIAIIEAKILELEQLHKDDVEARAKWAVEAAAFRSTMAAFIEGKMSPSSCFLSLLYSRPN